MWKGGGGMWRMGLENVDKCGNRVEKCGGLWIRDCN
jgi:hypothetical protein